MDRGSGRGDRTADRKQKEMEQEDPRWRTPVHLLTREHRADELGKDKRGKDPAIQRPPPEIVGEKRGHRRNSDTLERDDRDGENRSDRQGAVLTGPDRGRAASRVQVETRSQRVCRFPILDRSTSDIRQLIGGRPPRRTDDGIGRALATNEVADVAP